MSKASAISRTPNRKMFWRIVRHLLTANRSRLFVILLALAAGAAITAALLNLQTDARRRLSVEFRAFGANVMMRGKSDSGSPNLPSTPRLDNEIPPSDDGQEVPRVGFLYLLVEASPYGQAALSRQRVAVILAGLEGRNVRRVLPARILEVVERPAAPSPGDLPSNEVSGPARPSICRVGQKAAAALQIHAGQLIELANRTNRLVCFASAIEEFGGPEDNQIFTDLFSVQQLTWDPGEYVVNNVSVILLNVPGTPAQIVNYVAKLQKQFPDLDVHAIRQFSEAQGKIYSKISGLLTATVVLVLVLTALCVMAAMTNVAMERRNDVGLMKAIGGATRRVLRLFLTEAALLGLAGGLIGAAIGMALSVWLGEAVFGMAARPRLIVYPISVALTIIVAIISSYPLRRLASVRPASVFRGEA
jgi:putative ABC transport system permease protein